jgi:hypothetical protein
MSMKEKMRERILKERKVREKTQRERGREVGTLSIGKKKHNHFQITFNS